MSNTASSRPHFSLMDELQEVADENAAETNSLSNLHTSAELQPRSPPSSIPDSRSSAHPSLPASHPLAKYLHGVSGREDAEREDVNSAHEAGESSLQNDLSESNPAAESISDHPSLNSPASSNSSPSLSFSMLFAIAMEIIAPSLSSTWTPSRTLAGRTQSWAATSGGQIARSTISEEGVPAQVSEHIKWAQGQQITRQLEWIRSIYLVSIGLGLLQLLFCVVQLMLAFSHAAGLRLLPVVFNVERASVDTLPSIQWWPFMFVLWGILSAFNALTAYVSLEEGRVAETSNLANTNRRCYLLIQSQSTSAYSCVKSVCVVLVYSLAFLHCFSAPLLSSLSLFFLTVEALDSSVDGA
jgi:hypothetical protein